MELTLQIPDNVYAAYKKHSNEQHKPETLIVENIIHFASTKDGKRWLLVPPVQREMVEKLLGKGHITSPHQLVDRIEQRMRVSLGDITLKLTDAQLQKIKRMAVRQKKDPQKFLERVMDDVCKELLGRVG